MRVLIKPNMVWGALDSKTNFDRLCLNEDDLHINAVAKYNSGMFIILKPKSKVNTITLNYTIHYPIKKGKVDQVKANIQKVAFYTTIKTKQGWRSIDSQSLFNKTLGLTRLDLSDIPLTMTHDISDYKDISEIQICFPEIGYVKHLSIEMDCSFAVRKPIPISTIFVGSSIGTFHFNTSHNTIPCYIYRNYGLNTCTAAIPKAHSFYCPKLMDRLLKDYKNIEKILVDLENIKASDLTIIKKYIDSLDCFIFKPSLVHSDVDKIITDSNISNTFIATADMCCDWGHPNVYGTVLYINWLIENGKLIHKNSK